MEEKEKTMKQVLVIEESILMENASKAVFDGLAFPGGLGLVTNTQNMLALFIFNILFYVESSDK